MSENPFSLSFGIEPIQYIARYSQTNEIIDTFTSEHPSNYVYVISGIRGSGKTVMLSNLSDTFDKMNDWIVLNLTPDMDILNSIAAKLYSRKEIKKLFIDARIDLSAFGIGVSISDSDKIFDIETALEKMLIELKKKNKKVLIAIDEIVNNEYVRIFSGVFQIMLRSKLPIFLIATGLYENIYNLQNEKTLTFLYRSPKIILEALSLNSISRSYEQALNIKKDEATRMARLTKGYAFAYQALGYLYWKEIIDKKSKHAIDDILPKYDDILESYVYEKIWFELSPKEQEIIAVISNTNGEIKVSDLRAALELSSGNMSVYRDRLKKKGIIDTSKFGYISLNLPRFDEIIKVWID